MVMSWQYVAGFFDGEGSLRQEMGNNKNALQIYIVQAGDIGLATLKVMAEFLSERGMDSRIQCRPNLHTTRRRIFVLYLGSVHAEKFLRSVLPFLHIKKVQVQDTLRFRVVFPPANRRGSGAGRMYREAGHRSWAIKGRL